MQYVKARCRLDHPELSYPTLDKFDSSLFSSSKSKGRLSGRIGDPLTICGSPDSTIYITHSEGNAGRLQLKGIPVPLVL